MHCYVCLNQYFFGCRKNSEKPRYFFIQIQNFWMNHRCVSKALSVHETVTPIVFLLCHHFPSAILICVKIFKRFHGFFPKLGKGSSLLRRIILLFARARRLLKHNGKGNRLLPLSALYFLVSIFIQGGSSPRLMVFFWEAEGG